VASGPAPTVSPSSGAIGPAAPPPLGPGDPPLAILVDYDGTIARTDVSDTVMAEFVTAEWEVRAAEYDAGLTGSRRLAEWEIGLITTDEASLTAIAAAQPHDPGFARLVHRAAAARIPIEVVSDGFGFFIPAALASLGVGDVPVVTANTTFRRDGRPSITFPNGHPRCFVCGTCKRERVLAHRAAGRTVIFVGDGESDRYAAGYADLVFAKRALVRLCLESGWPFRRWTELTEVDAWLAAVLAAWRADPGTPTMPTPREHAFFCGPEVWGDGRWDPPAPSSVPTSAPSGRTPRTGPSLA
jgi:2-hydroxy-3-keto-5-methylthiopentenyl-1-phosphate phosphatase